MRIVTTILLAMALIATACNSKQTSEDDNCCENKEAKVVSNVNYPAWSKDATIYEVNIRQFTPEGTFAAFEEHLPRLKELGVEILWFMPIHPISEKNRKGTLGSYYAVQDYKAVNPEFGTFDDFKLLVSKCHEMGFKVLIDWVANHTGWDNKWIKEHPGWYTTDSLGNIITPVPDWSDVADLNFEDSDMRNAMIDALKFWVDEANIDGYRCDVAGEVPTSFWNDARSELEKIKPVYMLAEDEGVKELLVDAFNVNYGWEFHHIMNNIAKTEAGPQEVKTYFSKVDSTYPLGSYMMQFTSNHDENSWHGSAPERLGDALKAMAVLSFTVPGMPLIYNGQEAGLNKKLEFFEKDEIDWSNLEMQEFYAKLIDIKQENEALWNGQAGGEIHFVKTALQNDMLVFNRQKGDSDVLLIMNLSNLPVSNKIKCKKVDGTYKNLLTEENIKVNEDHTISLDAWEYLILSAVE